MEAEFAGRANTTEPWAPFLATLPNDALHRVETLLYTQAKACAADGDADLEALYATLGSICSYYLKLEEPLEPYGPKMVMHDSRTGVPADLRESDLDALAVMLPRVLPLSLRARVADVLWIRRRDRNAAAVAIESYVEATRRPPADWAHDSIEQIQRAAQIVTQLGRGGRELAPLVVDRILEMLADCNFAAVGYQVRLAKLLIEQHEVSSLEPCLAKWVVQARSLREEGAHFEARSWFGLAAEAATALDHGDDSREYQIAAAESWVAEAELAASGEDPSHMRAAGLMDFAIKAFRGIGGMRLRVDELHAKMLEWQELAQNEMQTVSAEVDLTSCVQGSMERVAGKALPQALVALALTYGYRDVGELRDEVIRLVNEFPLHLLFSRAILDDKGRVIARPPAMSFSDDEAREASIQAEMFRHCRDAMGIAVVGGIEPARRVIVSEHSFTFLDLLELIGPSPFIPVGHEQMYVRGLWAGFSDDFATAVAILAPELENALRDEMGSHGVMLPRLEADGVHRVRQLGELLYAANAEPVYGPAKLLTLKAVLSGDFGADMRDRVAHGLMTFSQYSGTDAAFLWWLALRLAIEPMIPVIDEVAPAESVEEAQAVAEGVSQGEPH